MVVIIFEIFIAHRAIKAKVGRSLPGISLTTSSHNAMIEVTKDLKTTFRMWSIQLLYK